MCVYIYIYIYTHVYIYIYIYTYINNNDTEGARPRPGSSSTSQAVRSVGQSHAGLAIFTVSWQTYRIREPGLCIYIYILLLDY